MFGRPSLVVSPFCTFASSHIYTSIFTSTRLFLGIMSDENVPFDFDPHTGAVWIGRCTINHLEPFNLNFNDFDIMGADTIKEEENGEDVWQCLTELATFMNQHRDKEWVKRAAAELHQKHAGRMIRLLREMVDNKVVEPEFPRRINFSLTLMQGFQAQYRNDEIKIALMDMIWQEIIFPDKEEDEEDADDANA